MLKNEVDVITYLETIILDFKKVFLLMEFFVEPSNHLAFF
jgi:hypothetical protein